MSRGRRLSDDGAITFIAYLMMAAIAIPILGVYWTFAGNTEGKIMIGILILVICAIAGIFSMFS